MPIGEVCSGRSTPNLAGGNGALNGNDPANPVSARATITEIVSAPGQSLVLR